MWSKKSKRRYYFREEETEMGTPRISPNLFDDGAVGLRIVAAMSGNSIESGRVARGKARSDPIPIRGRVGRAVRAAKEEEEREEEDDDDVELSESYTCVISRVGGGTVRKRVYLNAGDDDGVGVVVVDGIGAKFEMNSGVFFESPAAVGPIPGNFLSRCYLCRKKLHELDIFMYRGDEAFCSAECRCQQILNDEHKEKCWPEAGKHREKCWPEAGKPRDSPRSSYLVPLPYDAGVAAA